MHFRLEINDDGYGIVEYWTYNTLGKITNKYTRYIRNNRAK